MEDSRLKRAQGLISAALETDDVEAGIWCVKEARRQLTELLED